ncbi:immunity 17 family protein [uncultured Alistipes sp.]|uniref:immunity 17 family protein n=1 Tax=uncultured Alistipes sp. TaxID=538949 RepID=UPI00266CCEE1|nr:immunity 17 family protein [uncultured Alistipes sp.]
MNQISNNSYKFLSGFISETPHYGYLVAAAVLLFWLIGVICGWEWTYSRPGSYRGNFLLDLLDPRTYRLVLGVFLVVILALVLYLFVCAK